MNIDCCYIILVNLCNCNFKFKGVVEEVVWFKFFFIELGLFFLYSVNEVYGIV